jgi:hypothetical protein
MGSRGHVHVIWLDSEYGAYSRSLFAWVLARQSSTSSIDSLYACSTGAQHVSTGTGVVKRREDQKKLQVQCKLGSWRHGC